MCCNMVLATVNVFQNSCGAVEHSTLKQKGGKIIYLIIS